ncbi:MAG: pyridoxal phosphate-dependent aminotransferase [Acetobacteraceae bacterium]|nr:pyridoxal phosphate-dependent aminotransferase [Acetobacteraceae bacterium]
MPALARRLGRARVAATFQMMARVRALREAGTPVISLAIGEPDFATPPHAIDAAYAAARAGETKYPPVEGTKALREAVRRKFARENDLAFAPDEIIVTNGGKQAIFDALLATLDDGDEVVIPAPYWGAYPLAVEMLGGTPVFVDCPQAQGFKPRPEAIEAALSARTKWLLLNFPNNPSGAACSRAELEAIASVLRRYPHVWVMDDAMYEHLLYDDIGYRSFAAAAPDLRDRVLTVAGVSKTYAMTGWRIGFAAGPAPLIRGMANIQGHATSGVSTVGQAAAVAALEGPQTSVAVQAASYRQRRDLVLERLGACEGIRCHRPEGAFYVFPHIGGCLGKTTRTGRRLDTDADFATALLEEQHVAVVHGAAFGMSPHIRVSYATDQASLIEACDRIARFCADLR